MEAPKDNQAPERDLALLSWIQRFAPFGVLTVDTFLQVRSWNHWMEAHSSLASAQIIGRHLFEAFPELKERKLTSSFQRALAGESSVLSTALHQYLLPLKSPLRVHENDWMRQTARLAPLLAEGKVYGVAVVIEDVTQREDQAERLVRQHRHDEILSWALAHLLKSDEPRKTARQLFFKIAEHLDFDTFFLYLRDPESKVIKLYTAGGIADDLQIQFSDFELFTKVADADAAVVFDSVQNQREASHTLLRTAKISSAVAIPLRVNDKSLGTLCFASCRHQQIVADEIDLLTTIAQYLATAVDKENTRSALRRSEDANQWMGAIVESSDDAIISKDLNGVIKSCNEGAARLFGYEISELIGRPMRMLIPNDHQDEETQILEQIRSGKRIKHFETLRRRKDGSLIEVSLVISPVIDATGYVIGASNIARDITDRKQTEQKLAESFSREKLAREKAELANRAKDDFLAALSHELRTPLNPVLLIASEAAEDDRLPIAVRAQFATIRHNVELEARLIDDLLDITRITHGKLAMNLGAVDVHAVLNEAIGTVRSELDKKRIEFTLEPKAKQSTVKADSVRLQQVFWNVLKNAVKFTPVGGQITVSTRSEANGELTVAVTDTGIGMTDRELGRVFEAFSQGEHIGEAGSHRFGGLGLGLAISRKLMELHGGSIRATSKGRNQGSTFTMTLPLSGESPVKPMPADGKAAARTPVIGEARLIHILLVEDHEPTRTALAHLLIRRRYEVKTAASLAEARILAAKHEFQLLISDIGLPDGSGFELMDELRGRNPNLQGIALTGYGMEEDIAKGQSAGFGVHLTKPVGVHSLESALATVTARLR